MRKHLNPIIAADMVEIQDTIDWTLPLITQILSNMLDKILADESVITLAGALADMRYTTSEVRIAMDRWRGDPHVQTLCAKIHDTLHNRVVTQAAKSKINPVFGIFMLKNLYGWEDKRQIESKDITERIPIGKARKIFAAYETAIDITPQRPEKIGDYVNSDKEKNG